MAEKRKALLKVGDLEYEIKGDPLLVTNSIEGHIIIDDASIDRQHAILLEAPGTGDLSLLSLFSALGTFMHGERMVPMLSRLLPEGVHSIRFGDVETTIEVFPKEAPVQTTQQLLPSFESGIHESATNSTTDELEGALQLTASTSMAAAPSITEHMNNSTANVSIPESINNSTANGSKLLTSMDECFIPETQAVLDNEGHHDTGDSKENPYESQFRICTQEYNEDMGHGESMTQAFGAIQPGNMAECVDEGEMAELLGIITPCGTGPLSSGDDAFSRASTPDLLELAGGGHEASLADVGELVQDRNDENSKSLTKTQEHEKNPLVSAPSQPDSPTKLHKEPDCEGNLETPLSLDRSCTPDLEEVTFKKPFAKAPEAQVLNEEDDLCLLPTQVFPIQKPNADTMQAPKPHMAVPASVQKPAEPLSPLASTQAFRADIAATSTPSGDGTTSQVRLPNVAFVSPPEMSVPASSAANISPLPPTQVFKQEVVTPVQTPSRRRSVLQLRGTPSTSRLPALGPDGIRASTEPPDGEEKRQKSEPREFGGSALVNVKKETSFSQDSAIRRAKSSLETSLGRPKRSKRVASHNEESERENDKEQVKSRPVKKQARNTGEPTVAAKGGKRVKEEPPSEDNRETESQGRPTRKTSRQEKVPELHTSNEKKGECQINEKTAADEAKGSSRATRKRISVKEEVHPGSQESTNSTAEGGQKGRGRRAKREDPSLDKQDMKKEDKKKECKEDKKKDAKKGNEMKDVKKEDKEKGDKKKEGKEKEEKKVGKQKENNRKKATEDVEEGKIQEDKRRSRSRSQKKALPAESNQQEQTEAVAAKNKRKQSAAETTAKRRRQGSASLPEQATKPAEPLPSESLNASTGHAVVGAKLKTGKKWKVCFTAVDVRLVEKYSRIDAGPWKVVQDPTKCNVLVMDEPMRTFKFLVAMARGLPIYRSQWLDAMIANGSQPVDPTPFLFVSIELESKYKFSLWKSLDAASNGKLLDGYQFITTPGIVPSQSDMEVIIKCAGGVTLPDLKDPAVDPSKLYLISDEKQRRLWPALRRNCKSLRIIPTEAIMIAIMRQAVEPLSQRLS